MAFKVPPHPNHSVILWFILPREKNTPVKEAAKDISLHRPLAPSSVFLLETQAKMLIFAFCPPLPHPSDCFQMKVGIEILCKYSKHFHRDRAIN